MKELLREEREEVGLPIISSVWVYYIGGIPARRQRVQTSRSHEEHKAPFIPASLHRCPISKGLSKITAWRPPPLNDRAHTAHGAPPVSLSS